MLKIISILLFMLFSLQIYSQKNRTLSKEDSLERWKQGKESNLIHIGDKNGKAILYETFEKLLLIIEGEDIFILKKNQMNSIFINDRCEMYGHLLSDDYEVELIDEKIGKRRFLIKFHNEIFTEIYFPENRNKIYYHDSGRNEIRFYDLLKDELIKTNFIGNTLNVTNNYMYYVKEIDSNNYMPDVNLYRVSLDKMDKEEVVLKDTRESGIYVLPNDRYVYCETRLTGKGYRNILYDLKERKYDIIAKELDGYTPFYSIEKQQLGFFHYQTGDIKYYQIPLILPFEKR